MAEVGEFNRDDFKKIKLLPEDDKYYEDFTWNSVDSTKEELLEAIQKMSEPGYKHGVDAGRGCCTIL